MKRELFERCLKKIYAIHGKKAPENFDVVDAIYERVETLPPEFMDYAIEKFQDMEKLPANMGKFLKVDLWPEYLSENPQLRARASYECSECGGSGFIRAYRNGDGNYNGALTLFDCECRKGAQGWNRNKILATGKYSFTDMELANANPERFASFREKYLSTIGKPEEVRKEHADYLADWVEVDI